MEFISISKNVVSEEVTSDNYDFPTFYFSFPNKKFYFRPLSLEVGSLNFVNGEHNSGKSLFLKSLSGLEIPNEKPKNTNFLQYNIIYKPETITPKFQSTLQNFINEKSLQNFEYFQTFYPLLQSHLKTNIPDLPEDIKQILSFILFINREGLIYIFDCPPITQSIKNLFWNILKEFCYQNDKIALVVENNNEVIDEFINNDNGIVYYIRKFSENEYFGQCE